MIPSRLNPRRSIVILLGCCQARVQVVHYLGTFAFARGFGLQQQAFDPLRRRETMYIRLPQKKPFISTKTMTASNCQQSTKLECGLHNGFFVAHLYSASSSRVNWFVDVALNPYTPNSSINKKLNHNISAWESMWISIIQVKRFWPSQTSAQQNTFLSESCHVWK